MDTGQSLEQTLSENLDGALERLLPPIAYLELLKGIPDAGNCAREAGYSWYALLERSRIDLARASANWSGAAPWIKKFC